MKLSIETAERNGATVILANDPDADRFQLAEKQAEYVFQFLMTDSSFIICSPFL
ncbi:unnamed protein product [Anisakis simplex]|uniref:Alpha-D-phosphohexomutase alpha/beta/alpha domain-containing protein n=1 Tax=Anisakis simplex TaxID=6269 RepID=A0A3P6NQR8_ANISI|nr:unnamed protein product [Anisakis simplex]